MLIFCSCIRSDCACLHLFMIESIKSIFHLIVKLSSCLLILQVQLLRPLSKLQWKRCADMPVKKYGVQAVAIGDGVYMGGGSNTDQTDLFAVLKYNTVKDEWTRLPDHCVFFALVCVSSKESSSQWVDGPMGQVTKFIATDSTDRKWVESLKPMPTKRDTFHITTDYCISHHCLWR